MYLYLSYYYCLYYILYLCIFRPFAPALPTIYCVSTYTNNYILCLHYILYLLIYYPLYIVYYLTRSALPATLCALLPNVICHITFAHTVYHTIPCPLLCHVVLYTALCLAQLPVSILARALLPNVLCPTICPCAYTVPCPCALPMCLALPMCVCSLHSAHNNTRTHYNARELRCMRLHVYSNILVPVRTKSAHSARKAQNTHTAHFIRQRSIGAFVNIVQYAQKYRYILHTFTCKKCLQYAFVCSTIQLQQSYNTTQYSARNTHSAVHSCKYCAVCTL